MILNKELLLDNDPSGRRKLALELVEAAVEAVEPRRATGRAIERLMASGVDLEGCTVFAFGKAASGMAEEALRLCAPREGIVVGFDEGQRGPLTLLRGEHPIPSASAPEHGLSMLELAQSLDEDDVALCLVSGGGSSLLELPVEGVELSDLQATTEVLLASGAPIEEINAVRRWLSRIKGGRLAEALYPATVINVVLSDVPGADPSVVASGPTMQPVSEVSVASVVGARHLHERLPPKVVECLQQTRARIPDEVFTRVRTEVAADNETARRALVERAAAHGVSVQDRPGFLSGEARELGPSFYRECRGVSAQATVWGGETTVTLQGAGRGGRNHELVAACIEGYEGGLLLSIGTDGVDGVSQAAGALLDDGVVDQVARQGIDVGRHLEENDTGPLFAATGGQILTGPTGTNVADLLLYLP